MSPIRSRIKLGASLVCAVVGISLVSGCGSESAAAAAPATVTNEVTTTTTVSGPSVTVTATVTETPAPVTVKATPPGLAADGTFGDGTYLVGNQLQPGNYQASSPNNGAYCYWEINDASGGVISYGVDSGVMFIPDDAFSVRVIDCGTWSSVS